jgi:hypothetical protein
MILICGILALDSCPSATSLRQMRMPFPVGLANRILTGEPFKSLASFARDQRAITASFLKCRSQTRGDLLSAQSSRF